MFFSTPLAFAGSIAAAGLIAAYFFRTRFKSREVSNLMFWGAPSLENGHGTRKSRFRTPFVFYLELLIFTILVLAAATPLYRTDKQLPPVVVFDVSASMSARDGEGATAWEKGIKALEKEVGALDADNVRLFSVAESGIRNFGFVKPGDMRKTLHDSGFSGSDGELLGAISKARSLAGGATAVVVVTDKAPPSGYELPPGVKWLAAGASADNAGIAFAYRSITAEGDSLLAEIRTFPQGKKSLDLTLSGAGFGEATMRKVSLDADGVGRFGEILPDGTGEITLALPSGDVLGADDKATLGSPYSRRVPVVVDIIDSALRRRVVAAVEASGLASSVSATASADAVGGAVCFADNETNDWASTQVVFVKPQGKGMTAGNSFVLSSEPIFDGVDFTGISWNTGTNSLPGDGILYCDDKAVASYETMRSGKRIRIAAGDASDPLFRTAAFPETVWNILSMAGENLPGAAKCEWRFSERESNLCDCAELALGDISEANLPAVSVGYAAVWFGLAALALLAAHHTRWRGAWVLRAAVYAVLVIALFSPSVKLKANGGAVVVVADRSDSIHGAELDAELGMVNSLYAKRAAGVKTGVVSFGAASSVEDISADGAFPGFSTELDTSASDLSGAVETALGLFEDGEAGRLVLLTDGFNTGAGNIGRVAEMAAEKNVSIDYRLLSRPVGDDLAVTEIDVPSQVGKGEPILVSAKFTADRDADAVVTFSRGGKALFRGRRLLRKGNTRLYFRDKEVPEGLNLYSVSVEVTSGVADRIPENNKASFAVTSGAAKPVLVIPATDKSSLPKLLASGGADVVTAAPDQVEWSPAGLSVYSGIVVENRPADDFGTQALKCIASWVRHAGGAFAMTGGKNSFGMGGYRKSPIEEILPVSLEVRSEERKHDVAVAVVLDRSGSMGAACGPSLTKMDLANIATVETLETLRDGDGFAVVAVDSEPHVIVPMSDAEEAKKLKGKIRSIDSAGGGIFVFAGLKSGIRELLKSNAKIRHLILFADASDSEQPEEYAELLVSAREVGITVSVVGLGTRTDCDAELLVDIADLGGGTCSFSADPGEIPRLFAQDTIIMSRMSLETNLVSAAFTSSILQYSDSLSRDAPQLHGYNICHVKPDATTMAVSVDDNKAPLLATGRVGSGRVLAFTGEVDGELSGPFAQWDDIDEFYAAMARFCTGDGQSDSGYFLRQKKLPGGIEITAFVDRSDSSALAADGLEVTLLASGRHGRDKTVGKLEWNGADCLSGFFPISASEVVLPVVTLPSGKVVRMPAVCNPYSPEYLPDDKQAGERNLKELAEKTGGRRLVNPADVWRLLPETTKDFDLSPFLYLLAAVLFVAEVILRRLGVDIPLNASALGVALRKLRETSEKANDDFADTSVRREAKKSNKAARTAATPVILSEKEKKAPGAAEPEKEGGLLGEAAKRAGARLKR